MGTSLAKTSQEFPKLEFKDLVQHGVNALKETVRTRDLKLTTDNVSVMVVGEDVDLKQLNDDELQPYVDKVEGDDDGGDNDDDEDDDIDMKGTKPATAQ